MMYSVLFFMILLCCVYSLTTIAPVCIPDIPRNSWTKETFPNPLTDIGKCGRGCKPSWICDPSNIITPTEADNIDTAINDIRFSGSCSCSECSGVDGYNISMAIVPEITKHQGFSDAYTEAREFSQYIRRQWSFQKCDNDVVIFLSVEERQVYTNAGSNAHSILTSDCIDTVYQDVKDLFTDGKYYDGIQEMIQHYRTIFMNGNCDHIKDTGEILPIIIGIAFSSAFVIGIIAFVCICRHSGSCHSGGPHGRYSYDHNNPGYYGDSGVGGGGGGDCGGGGGGGDGGGGGGGF